MKEKLSKMPPLGGSTEHRYNEIRGCFNRLIDELTRALEAQERELEHLRKEIHSREKQQ